MTTTPDNEPILKKSKSWSFDAQRLFTSVAIAIGILFIIFGVRASRTGRDESGLPTAIERMSPANGDRVLRQSQIIVDFVEGYEEIGRAHV